VHTYYSEDATTTPEEIINCAKKQGLDGVAVTDHNTVAGVLKLIRKSELVVIPGLEIETLHGHVLALNVKTNIASKMSLVETTEKIHDMGGIAVAAHPTGVLKTRLAVNTIASSNFDAMEVINSVSFPFFFVTHMNRRLAEHLKLPQTAGSDAHHVSEIGAAFTLIDSDPDSGDIAEAIRKGATIPHGKPITWTKRLQRVVFHLRRSIF
jgi:predicted metal-dependent phosphoesterase TrpH